jgi:hypothetical protein
MNEIYEKQCTLESQRLEMMSSMMQANQQMVSLMTMLAQRLPMAQQPATHNQQSTVTPNHERGDRHNHHD